VFYLYLVIITVYTVGKPLNWDCGKARSCVDKGEGNRDHQGTSNILWYRARDQTFSSWNFGIRDTGEWIDFPNYALLL